MALYYFTTSQTSASIIQTLGAGDTVVVAANVNLFETGGAAIYGTSFGSAEITGTVAGYYGLLFNGQSGQTTSIQVDQAAVVSSVGVSGFAIVTQSGTYSIYNAGQITAVLGASATAIGVSNGGGAIRNYGLIEGTLAGVESIDATAADNAAIYNFGTITGSRNAIYDYGGHSATVYNYGSIVSTGLFGAVYASGGSVETLYNSGTITGAVSLLSGGSIDNASLIQGSVTFGASGSSLANSGRIVGSVQIGGGTINSTLGSITGTIATSGSSTVIAGQTGGLVLGGAGNDILYANPTQTAANNAAQTTLDGGAGVNALYGDGAFTTFLAGDTNGGYNQIWGGASQMIGVSGYTNNTISFASDGGKGVFVDLLNGHNAYVSSSGGWSGSGTFEDAIVNVPNVIGSSVADVIQADNGTDRIQGGGGADALYSGAGQDTFVYTAYADSNLVNGYDTIVGFKLGTDKIDLSALHVSGANLAISTSGTSNTLYIEQTPGTLNSATDLAMIVNTSAAGGLHASDFIF